MRTFGTDKPEFMQLKIGNSKKVHQIPLASSLPMSLNYRFAKVGAMKDESEREVAAQELQLDMLNRYLGEDVVNDLTFTDVQKIFEAWHEESKKQGADSGE